MLDRLPAGLRPVVLTLGAVGWMAVVACAHRAGAPGPPAGLPVRRAAPADPEERLDADLRSKLAGASPERRFVALVDLSEQLDLVTFARRLNRIHPSKSQRRTAVVEALERVAATQQARLQPLVDRLVENGSIGYARPVAIVNRILVEGTAEGIKALATSPEVAHVLADWTSERAASRSEASAPDVAGAPGERFDSWAPGSLGAERLWARGFDGRGVVVATIDTGAYESHEQLAGRRVPGEAGWYDPVNGTTVGSDTHGHGTGVLSQAVGGNPDHRIVGIAPAARWAAALGNWRNFYVRSRMTLAADWILRTARPDVLVNAWSHDEGTCSTFDRPFIDAWKASGIFVVFPAGNGGPGPATGECPAQLAGVFPDAGAVFSVAGLSRAGVAATSSSRGPSRCGSTGFPSLAVPGEDLPIASLGGPRSYAWGRGTSLSAGLAGGAAALLVQAVPEAGPEEIESALLRSARDVSPAGRDDATGAGAVDLEAALALLAPDLAR